MSTDASKKIAYLERRIADLEAQYDKLAKDAYHFRRLAQRFEFAIRDHRDHVLKSRSESAANLRLWHTLDS